MINVERKKEGNAIVFLLKGKLNSEVVQEVRAQIKKVESGTDVIKLDFTDLKYVSSAGLRVILEIHKDMKASNKSLVLTNVDPGNMDILESTGLTKFLNIRNEQ